MNIRDKVFEALEKANNDILLAKCDQGQFRFELDYAYLFDYLPMYDEGVYSVIDSANTIFLCIKYSV